MFCGTPRLVWGPIGYKGTQASALVVRRYAAAAAVDFASAAAAAVTAITPRRRKVKAFSRLFTLI